jgi:hypothetical protein
MGSPWLMFVISLGGLISLPLLKFMSGKIPSIKKRVQHLNDQLKWSFFLDFLNGLSLEITASAII